MIDNQYQSKSSHLKFEETHSYWIKPVMKSSGYERSASRNDHSPTDQDKEKPNGARRIIEPFLIFLRLGLTSFGGPIAHLGYFRQEFVERRCWLSDQSFADLVALCQFLPGPTSSQVCYSIGMMRGGLLGAIGAWFGFTFPSALLMVLAAYGLRWAGTETGASWLHGLKIVAVAVVAQAVWSMATRLCVDRLRIGFAIIAAVVILLSANSWIQVLAIGVGALAGWKLIKAEANTRTSDPFAFLPSWSISTFSLGLFAFCLLLLPSLGMGKHDGWLALFDSFYRAGSLVFGGGHVVLPLLQAEVVPKGWVDNGTFLAGYGLAQALPGPLFSFAAYLGAAKTGNPTGWLAGLWCLFAILLPPILLVNGLLPVWNHLRSSTAAQALLAGANATVVGILLAALYQPIWTSAIDSPRSFSLAVVLFSGLQFWKIPPWILVVIGGIAGGLFL
jgi:chromate transporter